MSLGLKVNVIHILSEQDSEDEDMGIQMDLSNAVSEEYAIYTIDYTKRFNKSLAIISSAGLDFIVAESYESLNKRIEERQTFGFN
jgi:hypothetical protein